MHFRWLALGSTIALFASACSAGSSDSPGGGANANGGGSQLIGQGASNSGGGNSNSGDNCDGVLQARIRDFHTAFPDMEIHSHDPTKQYADDKGIVTNTLGSDRKPVYAGDPTTGTISTSGKANFDKWYRDTPGTGDGDNYPIDWSFKLSPGDAGDVATYNNQSFFPIDGKGYGNETDSHNYHFTFELHTNFTYQGGETFVFNGDDDVFVYIDNKLEVNLGGVHGTETGSITVDKLGLTVGQKYNLDLFFAERHVVGSDIRIDTSLKLCSQPVLK